jgi:hypothetical protein
LWNRMRRKLRLLQEFRAQAKYAVSCLRPAPLQAQVGARCLPPAPLQAQIGARCLRPTPLQAKIGARRLPPTPLQAKSGARCLHPGPLRACFPETPLVYIVVSTPPQLSIREVEGANVEHRFEAIPGRVFDLPVNRFEFCDCLLTARAQGGGGRLSDLFRFTWLASSRCRKLPRPHGHWQLVV